MTPRARLWAVELSLALVLVVASHAVPTWIADAAWLALPRARSLEYGNLHDLVSLAFGALLAVPTARQSGLTLGRRPTLAVVAVALAPVLATALVYPNLPTRPFAGQRIGMWLVSPFAQDLLFVGYLYGRFARLAPPTDARRPQAALLATCGLFALWHVPNFFTMPAGYVVFQLGYTFAGLCLTGLSRQWTRSALYAMATHVLVNFIAWMTP